MAQSWLLGWLVLLAMPMLALVAATAHGRRCAAGGRLRPVARSALLYGVLGPPLGALLIGIPALLSHDDPEPVVMLLFLMAMSYLPGLLPALAGGACMGLLRPMLGRAARVAVAALVCGLGAGVFGVTVLDLPAGSLPQLGGLGAGSGAILEGAWLWRQRRRESPPAGAVRGDVRRQWPGRGDHRGVRNEPDDRRIVARQLDD